MKGILKKGSEKKEAKQLAFDEGNLCENERSRPEGGYTKIDEPKTPFAHDSSEQDEHEALDEQDLQIQLVLEKSVSCFVFCEALVVAWFEMSTSFVFVFVCWV